MTGLLVNIDVDDLARAEAFYCAAFGLTCGRRLDGDVVELVGGPVPIYLLYKPTGSLASAAGGERRGYGRHWTPVHLDWAVDDLGATIERATAAGAVQEGETRHHEWGSIAMFADPFGHGFCLLQFRGRGYDEIADA